MVKPRFFALTIWEPSVGRTDTHIHDKVELCYNNNNIIIVIISMMNKKKEINRPWSKGVEYDPLIHGLGSGANPEPLKMIWGKSPRWKNGWLKRKSRRVCKRVSTYIRLFR